MLWRRKCKGGASILHFMEGTPGVVPTSTPFVLYNYRLLVIQILAALLLLGLTAFLMYRYGLGANASRMSLRGLEGRAYLSLVPLETSANGARIGIYEYDLHTRKIYKTLVDANDHMTPAYAGQEPQVLFASRAGSKNFQIELYDERVKLPPFPVTNSTSSEKRFPVWSPDRRSFAFTAHGAGGRAITPNDWSVYVYSFRSREHEESSPIEETRVASGYSPTFSPSGSHVMYLRNDGIYAQPSGGGAEFRLAKNPADLSSRFSISNDGTLLVWTRPAEKTVDIFAIENPLALTLRNSLTIELLEPHFAGLDNAYIVGIGESAVAPGTRALVALNAHSGVSRELLSLRLFDRNQILLSDVRR